MLPYELPLSLLNPHLHPHIWGSSLFYLLGLAYQVDCPRMCALSDLTYKLSRCHAGKLRVTYLWNATTLSQEVS
jgi:hypothetical protein